ncbi:DUF4149 domain-containing protein [uncultured Hydrogenophaga sp.]|uniref:DUF4149 domain-containing protein n=1 Tax=uncultured Hydrogenophaga sp. TaxID=199683 RepID=UPI00265F0453|nr:DUF4149 domain-containing protein [uncultured Hydrogenophaga sp.]
MLQRLPLMLAALWWGGISALSFLAVPLLFARLGSPAVAGPVAAQIFSLQCWAGIIIGGLLLVLLKRGQPTPEAFTTLGLVCLAMLLALVQEFGVAQKIVTARASGGDLKLWHTIGSVMVLGQWLCPGAVLWRLGAVPRGHQQS